MKFIDDPDADVVEAAMGLGIRRRLTAWATAFRGPCHHPDRDQFTRIGDIRSACWACTTASPSFGSWQHDGPCDLCGRVAPPPNRVWSLPPQETGSVAVLLRLCPACQLAELTDPEPDDDPELEPPC